MTHTDYLTVYGGFTGNLVKVTDPAGRWKMQMNALGQLWQVIEPDPLVSGGKLVTTYTYDALGHMTRVEMPRGGVTQTRIFGYTDADLTSATNPENGTVNYQYDGSHRVTKRTDAKGQETRYSYDAYGRVAEVQHWALIVGTMTELGPQRVTYHYDTNPLSGSYTANGYGRLTSVEFRDAWSGGSYFYMYSYNQAGRVTAQRMDYDHGAQVFDAAYSWDNEGRMTATNYGPSFTFQYDVNGRLSGMQEVGGSGSATASYDPALGVMTGMSYFGFGETRGYNNLLQMTSQTVANSGTNVMNVQYDFGPAGQNNGRLVASTDVMIGETVNYTYDALNRLASAVDTNGSWGQGFTYDGFGNLTNKTVLAGSAPTLNVSFDGATNRQVGVTYDANGNPAGPTYDVENRVIGEYVYDHAGKRVRKGSSNSNFELYFYGIGGQKLATMACVPGCTTTYNVYFGGKLVKSKGVVVATDRLGSVRGNSLGESFRYYPYGEERTTTADNREKFGTYTRDSSGVDYADQRYYAVGMGRFNTPDPYRASAGAEDSGSWNRYVYVGGDPVNFKDPRGLWRLKSQDEEPDESAPDNHEHTDKEDDQKGPGGGGGDGGANLNDALTATRNLLAKEKCVKAVGGELREDFQTTENLLSLLKDGNPTISDNLPAPTAKTNVTNPNVIDVSFKLGVTADSNILINGKIFPDTLKSVDGTAATVLGAFNQVYGISFSGTQMLTLTILHELSHMATRPDDSSDPVATREFNRKLIADCFN